VEHRAYPKIASRPTDGRGVVAGPWVATEKIHGAQLVVATDGRDVRVGKRKAWLDEGDAFFGWQLLRNELAAAARGFHRALGGAGVVRLYGEIFGGHYPHPDVAAMPGASPVQTGVWYAPDVRFAVFDALVEGRDDPAGFFVAHHELDALARAHGMYAPPVLARGPRGDVDAHPVRFATRVPAQLGLPALADNVAEGLVLKSDARARPDERPVLKRKIPEFDEQRFDDSAPWDADARLDLDALGRVAARLVNPPRVASARSKVGNADRAALRDEVVLDVLVDLEAAFPRALRELSAADDDALRARIAALAEHATREA
jgi:Rnl2 family RNA ligase